MVNSSALALIQPICDKYLTTLTDTHRSLLEKLP